MEDTTNGDNVSPLATLLSQAVTAQIALWEALQAIARQYGRDDLEGLTEAVETLAGNKDLTAGILPADVETFLNELGLPDPAVLASVYYSESGEVLTADVVADLVAHVEESVDDDLRQSPRELAAAVRYYLRRVRQCEHGRPLPSHPDCPEGEPCPQCAVLARADLACDLAMGN
jgi:hypothetical protein